MIALNMSYLEIDGSQGEGGGQIVRTAMSLATILREPVRITKIRAKRKVPGLRPQHLQSVLAASRLCNGSLKGAHVGSTEIIYEPGDPRSCLTETIDTGSAGSISLIAQTITPISIFCNIKLDLEIRGGTEVSNSPTIDYLARVVLPVYKGLCPDISIEIKKRGYYPRGGGIVKIKCAPKQSNSQIRFRENGIICPLSILSVSRGLPAHVCDRQIAAARSVLASSIDEDIMSEADFLGDSLSVGSSVLVYKASSNCLVGGSSLGMKGKRAEEVGKEAATAFLQEVASSPNVDSHLADMLVTLLACMEGDNEFTCPAITEHLKTNSDVAKQITKREVNFIRKDSLWLIRVLQ
ncbi:MAG: RNA 3'-terminal phosphate cyclase [Thaumarchaeota archaeon]|nr:RNA 3'-terminal phosphate cyclase [Nitrososphaerota archaeon]